MKSHALRTLCAATFAIFSTTIGASPITVDITATIGAGEVAGSFSSSINIGDVLNGSFIFDTDEANASSAETTPSTEPGHEFTSFYDFSGSPYDVQISGTSGFGFDNEAPIGVVVNNDLSIAFDDTNGLISPGTYDWIEVLGSTASDIGGAHTPGNGQEWTLAFFADDANWFSDGSVIPDSLPASYTAILVGIDLDENGDEIGVVFTTVDSVAISSVPIPAAVWLFGSGLLGLIGVARRKKAA